MRLVRDEAGTVMVEYALVLSLLSFAFIGGMFSIESATSSVLGKVQYEVLQYALRNGR